MEDNTEIRTQLLKYVTENDYLTHNAIADFIGTNTNTFRSYLYGRPKNSSIAHETKRFMLGVGKQLAEIRTALQANKGNRIRLHQKRANIFHQL